MVKLKIAFPVWSPRFFSITTFWFNIEYSSAARRVSCGTNSLFVRESLFENLYKIANCHSVDLTIKREELNVSKQEVKKINAIIIFLPTTVTIAYLV